VLEYYEIPELPERKFFRCEPLRASITTEECSRRWRAGNLLAGAVSSGGKNFVQGIDADKSGDVSMRCFTCKGCPMGARHAGVEDANPSQLKGSTVCSRCHQGCTRLIAKHLCISCYNRQREQLVDARLAISRPGSYAPRRSSTPSI
jgi:hypothetical protein